MEWQHTVSGVAVLPCGDPTRGRATTVRSAAPTASILQHLGELFSSVEQLDLERTPVENLNALAETFVAGIPGARCVTVDCVRHGHLDTVASTHPIATELNRMQGQVRSGPVLDAIDHRAVVVSDALRHDRRWPSLARWVAQTTQLDSVMSVPLALDDELHTTMAATAYGDSGTAFDSIAQAMMSLAATHGAVQISRGLARRKAVNLEKALETSRDIGAAVGILMYSLRVTRDDAFDLLRIASQRRQQKLRDIAMEVAETGQLDAPAAVGP
jgi:hypothetical protein